MEETKSEATGFDDPQLVIKTLPKYMQIILLVMGYNKDQILGRAEFQSNLQREMNEVAYELLEQTSSLTRSDFVEALTEARLDADHFKLYSGHFLEIKMAQDTINEQQGKSSFRSRFEYYD